MASVLGDISNLVAGHRGSGKAQAPVPLLRPASKLSGVGSSLLRGAPPPASALSERFATVFQGDDKDPQRVSEYAADVFAGHLAQETMYLPKPDYIDGQKDINGKMRAILIDWLVEVHMKYRLRPETLFLAMNIIDRYLSVRPVIRKKMQLLGVVAMFIAAKFEEIDPPKAQEFAYITDNTYTKKEIVRMECNVLEALDYQIAVTTPAHLLERLQRVNSCDAVHRSLVQYALELSLMDLRFLRHPPSVLVGAALLMSNEYLGRRSPWPAEMAHHSQRSEAALRPLAADLKDMIEKARAASLQAVRKKYSLELHNSVANLLASPVHVNA